MISSLAGLAMPITWAAFNIKWQGDRPVSSAASVRYRLILPAQALAASGHQVKFLQLGLDSRPEEVARDLAEGVLVLSKLSPDPSVFDRMAALMVDLIARARERGIRVLLDVSDDHFSDPLRGKYLARAETTGGETAGTDERVRLRCPRSGPRYVSRGAGSPEMHQT